MPPRKREGGPEEEPQVRRPAGEFGSLPSAGRVASGLISLMPDLSKARGRAFLSRLFAQARIRRLRTRRECNAARKGDLRFNIFSCLDGPDRRCQAGVCVRVFSRCTAIDFRVADGPCGTSL